MSEHCFGGPYAVPYMVPVSECCSRYGGPCGSDEPSGPGRYSFLQSRRSTGRSGGICREEAGQFPARLEWGACILFRPKVRSDGKFDGSFRNVFV